MKTIKPQRLSVLHRTFEAAGHVRLCVTAMLAGPFDEPFAPIHEASLWKMLAAELGKDTPPDACMPKLKGEVLLNARAYPRGGARPACSVRVTLGALDKTLWVAGERFWMASKPTDPIPFASMPIRWDRAFGGLGHPQNPTGKGFAPIKTDSGALVHPLPNIEDTQASGPLTRRPSPARELCSGRHHVARQVRQDRHV